MRGGRPTVFQGGRLQGQLKQATARQEELTENYRKTILVALKELEDALAAVVSSRKRELNLNEDRAQAQIAYDLSQQLYDA